MPEIRTLRDRVRETIPYGRVPFWRGQIVAVVCVTIAAVLRWPLDPFLSGRNPFVTFFPAVLLASIWGGSRAGITAVGLTLLAAGVRWDGTWDGLTFKVLPLASLVAFALFGGIVVLLSDFLRSALKDLAQSKQRAQLLADEMRHRVKNSFAMAAAISRQTARNVQSVDEYQQLLDGRLAALARAQELGSENEARPPELPGLVSQVLEPFVISQFVVSGPVLVVPPDVSGTLSLLFHELATNATKYGALSVPTGKVSISWTRGPAAILIDWTEIGGPAVKSPERQGFGSKLLRSAFPADLATVTMDYPSEGVRCRIELVAPLTGPTNRALPPTSPDMAKV